ncbi:MAG: hypothetical protein RLZZ397_291 [Pseudomonadota bacterium]|jgi:nicotinamidase-related amidase
MLLQAEESQLLIVDLQERLMAAMPEKENILLNAHRLAQAARWLQVPVWGTEQVPHKLGPNVSNIRALCQQTLSKEHFSGVPDGLLELLMPAPKPPGGNARSLPKHLQKAVPAPSVREHIVITGCEAHVCVLQTALDLLEQEELQVWIVTDACGSRTERNRDAAYDRLAAAGAELVTTEMVLFEWMGSAQHPKFRDIQALIK